jgi:hypothetical protein
MGDPLRLHEAIDKMDFMHGCNGRSVQSMEALMLDPAYRVSGLTWGEAYLMAKQRAREPGADQHDGRTVAFLEGLALASRIALSAAPFTTKGYRAVRYVKDHQKRVIGEGGYAIHTLASIKGVTLEVRDVGLWTTTTVEDAIS